MKNKKNKRLTIDDLAGMTKRGFDETGNKIDTLGKQMQEGFNKVSEGMKIMSENNAREHEEIKMRLDNVAYRFELVELQKRVDVLEKKTGIKK